LLAGFRTGLNYHAMSTSYPPDAIYASALAGTTAGVSPMNLLVFIASRAFWRA